jgi:hypothetical protein
MTSALRSGQLDKHNSYTYYWSGLNSIIFIKEKHYLKYEIESEHLLPLHSVTKLHMA